MKLEEEGQAAGEVFRDILEWASSLPRWQQELLRRILRMQELSGLDVEELADAAVDETELQPSKYSPLSIDDVPAVAGVGGPRRLIAVRKLRNVNALRPDQTLAVGPNLTVVYGDNASGKSGYARVLKKIYRARVVEDILGDLRSETPSPEAASAEFVVMSPDGAHEVVSWVDGRHLSQDPGRFAVLDATCSLTYVRGGTLAVGPAGIDVPRRFAEALDAIKRLLASRTAAAQPDKRILQHLETDSEAGRFVGGLSASTPDAAVAASTKWDSEMGATLQRVGKSLADARTQTPSARRSQLRSRLAGMEALETRLAKWTSQFRAAEVAAIREAQVALQEADISLLAVQTLADTTISVGAVPSTAWVELLRVAARYVSSLDPDAYATTGFSIDGKCALCWQVLDDAAQDRLGRFRQHLEGAALQKRRDAAERIETLLGPIRTIPDEMTPEEGALLADDEALRERIKSLMAELRSRRDVVLEATSDGTPLPPLELPDVRPLDELRERDGSLRREVAEIPQTDSEAALYIAGLERQILELESQRAVSESADNIRSFIRGLREHQRIRNAGTAINTRAVSSKASELHAKHMTDRYSSLVDEELKELRFRRRHPILSQKTNKANVEVAPLVSPELRHIPAEKVFSEGERTAIALACFLAELRLGDDPSGLIFDDPISSLDHSIREHVARRLVAASKMRQVVVFTHDLAFLADLREQAKKIQLVDCQFRTLVSTDYATGFVEPDEPFGARSVKKRIGVLKQLLTSAEVAARKGDLGQVRSVGKEFYEGLRSTWERFVEERLFANVVQRLERHVIVGAIGKVAYSKELGEKVHEGWRRCSNVLEAHDHAPAAGGQSYSVEEMKADLAALSEADKLAPQ